MSLRVWANILVVSLALVLTNEVARGSLVWIYDFPGTPGSGVGNNQTNPQPMNATFGDWTRVNLSAGATSDAFDSTFWDNTSSMDPTQYASFTITADAGYHLNLQSLMFDELRTAGGPTKAQIQMFVNGSTTAWDLFNYNPDASWTTRTFNFTPTTDADNVTLVEFRFYGWNGGTPEASLLFDNVAVTLNIVPERSSLGAMALVLSCAVFKRRFSRHSR